jgi:hypothetical protein
VLEVVELLIRGPPRKCKIERIQIREMPAHRIEASLVVEVEVEGIVEDLTHELELVVWFRVTRLSPGLSGFQR